MIEPDVESAIGFLSLIFDVALEGYVNLFTVERESGQRRTAWAPIDDLRKLEQPIWDFAIKGDVWFGCAVRREPLPNGQRGGVADCLGIPGLWLDLDVGGEGHRLEGLFSSYEDARQFVDGYQYSPDIVVRSGYGFQVWWLYDESLSSEDAIPELARWRAYWMNRATTAGIHVDDVWDLPRVMRLPGTFNRKGSVPIMVTYRAAYFPVGRFA
jgi:hypothetical protein